MFRRLIAVRVLVVFVAIGLAGCSPNSATPATSNGSTDSPSTSLPEPPEETTTTRRILEIPTEWPSDREEIIGRYELYVQAFEIAIGPPIANPDYPPLKELSAGEQADIDRELLKDRRSQNRHAEQPDPSVSRTEYRFPSGAQNLAKTEGSKFVFRVCIVDDDIIIKDDKIINDRVVSFIQDVRMEVVDGQWRVTGLATRGETVEGESACDDFS